MTGIVKRSNVQSLEEEIASLEAEQGVLDEEGVVTKEETPPQENKQGDIPLGKEEETFKKRYGDLRRLSQQQAEKIKELEKAPAKASQTPTTANEAKKWAEANPAAAAVIKALALEELKSNFDPSVKELDSFKKEVETERAQNKILKVHSDFTEVTTSDEFHTWANNQPTRVQDLIFDGDADDVIWAISAYKEQAKNAKRNPDKEAAQAIVKKSSTPTPKDDGNKTYMKESDIERMTANEYAEKEAEILVAQREGRLIYDRSGAAR
jgi:hypothetical protein